MLECKLFGLPKIYENGKEIILPISKMSGVLYYLLVKKSATRDELCGLFWSESNDTRAKASLRNVLHKIRKLFKEDILLSNNRTIISLNEKINIRIDIDNFDSNPLENLAKYDEFLSSFYLKGAYRFEEWVFELQEYYKRTYIDNYIKKIENSFINNNLDTLENDIKTLLQVDTYNEDAYYNLILYYQKVDKVHIIV